LGTVLASIAQPAHNVRMSNTAHLDQARKNLTVGKKIVRAQRDLIERMEAAHQDTGFAEKLLATFEQTLKVMKRHLFLEKEADQLAPWKRPTRRTIELFPFRYKDPIRGRWIRARYLAERHELVERYAEFEIVGAPERRTVWDDPLALSASDVATAPNASKPHRRS
jgi:hypothetical protein